MAQLTRLQKATISLGLVVFFGALVGCSNNKQPVTSTNAVSGFVTPQGIKVEQLIPNSAIGVVQLGASDQNQQQNLNNLLAAFPKEVSNFNLPLPQFLIPPSHPDAQATNQDFQSMLVNPFKVMVSVDEKPAPSSQESPTTTQMTQQNIAQTQYTASLSSEFSVSVRAFFLLQDPTKAQSMMTRLVNDGEYSSENYKGYVIYTRKDTSGYYKPTSVYYVTIIKDLLVTSDLSADALKQSIDLLDNGTGSLLVTDAYQKALSKNIPHIGYAYFNPHFLTRMMAVKSPKSQEVQNAIQGSDLAALSNAVEGDVLYVAAENNDLHFVLAGFADPDKLKDSKINFKTFYSSQPAYLYKEVPVGKTLYYVEGSNFKQIVDLLFQIYDKTPATAKLHQQVRDAFKSQGLDFDKDFLSLFDKNFAFVFFNPGSFMPGMALYVDTSSNPEAVQKLLARVDMVVRGLVFVGKSKLGSEAAAALSLTDTTVNGGKATVVRFDMSKLPQISTAPDFVKNLKLEFWYGTTKDNISFLALYPGFDKDWGIKTLEKDPQFQLARGKVSGDLTGFFYLSPSNVQDYFELYVQLILAENPKEADKMQEVEKVMTYLKPLQSIILYRSNTTDIESDTEGYVIISKPQ